MGIYTIERLDELLEWRSLPKEDSDFSLPGRIDESDAACFGPEIDQNQKASHFNIWNSLRFSCCRGICILFSKSEQIDSQILDNTAFKTLEEKMANHYGVGQFGSEHAHAALVVFVNGDQWDFSHPQFQIQSKYIHFENDNPYLIHKHATNVPLDMLFSSFGLKITEDCIKFVLKQM